MPPDESSVSACGCVLRAEHLRARDASGPAADACDSYLDADSCEVEEER